MATGYEIEMYQNISVIAQSLRRIAEALEAQVPKPAEGSCTVAQCDHPVVLAINGVNYCLEHLDFGFRRASQPIKIAQAAIRATED